jgi:hypothetical protein
VRIGAALLSEAERLMREHYARGVAIERICAWLGGLEPSWLSGAAPALGD